VAAQSGVQIMSPGEFVQEIRGLVVGGLWNGRNSTLHGNK
jgi:hypothetical protein